MTFFLQMAIILATCRLVGLVGRRLGQPQVVGEMVAGVLLGPSLFGLLLPDVHARLFPRESLQVLYVGAQLGIGLYMFLVGVEFKTELFRSRLRSALSVSLSGMLLPFALGSGLAIAFTRMPGLFSERVTTAEAMLFLGAAMSITAFPMLARIIHERGLTGTALGTLALAAGCIDDAVAWCVLAVVLASFGGGAMAAATTIAGGAAYALLVLTLGRRALRGLETHVQRAGGLTPTALAVVLMLFMLAGWLTDAIGLHTVFGGFLLGVAMPRCSRASCDASSSRSPLCSSCRCSSCSPGSTRGWTSSTTRRCWPSRPRCSARRVWARASRAGRPRAGRVRVSAPRSRSAR